VLSFAATWRSLLANPIEVRRLPHRVEDRELRIVYWRTLITSLRVVHVDRFPNRSFGKDLQLIVVYGSVILAFLEGRKPTIANIARYLELPHETTRRYLKTRGPWIAYSKWSHLQTNGAQSKGRRQRR
jgi:hypothetical protein